MSKSEKDWVKILSNPHGSDVTEKECTHFEFLCHLSNPHGSDVTKYFNSSD